MSDESSHSLLSSPANGLGVMGLLTTVALISELICMDTWD